MEYTKPFLSINEQIEKLKSDGILFDKLESDAALFFQTNNFYRFKGYALSFQDESKKFSNVHFKDVTDLYFFDHRLRLLLFEAISQIEITLRAQIVYQYALKYGSHWYLDSSLFKEGNDKIDFHQSFLNAVDDEISRSRDLFISHYQDIYCKPTLPPCWMCLEVISFGSLSKKLYSNLVENECKTAIAAYFGVSPTILQSWLNHIAVIRNICAHHSRLWNRTLPRIQNNSKYYIRFQGSKNICISV
ncbi:hypothetical protein MmiAt1_14160 [Methanimicrococcus sp. At1]|uniref:Abi family protein n=1 Tax=Methanimicrococcus hacksteinii TaxID=3028293 RepID=A0ABU3VQX8_9EURY|nr:Abi family protein [Methanimicrococcus sp. At1]MDV0445819.1 hypothetical protein [Methanimicrococcus sp. At1]